MGQGLGCGAVTGVISSSVVIGASFSLQSHIAIAAGCTAAGLSVDLLSDVFARQGKIEIEKEVILNAAEPLRHLHSFYAHHHCHAMGRLVRQKHEWVVLESHAQKFYIVQKSPGTGSVSIGVRNTLRAANDEGLRTAARPIHTGEIQQHRMDQDFDLPNDLQVAYIIAWLRKEDPRWAFSTENSRHFAIRLRYALNDF